MLSHNHKNEYIEASEAVWQLEPLSEVDKYEPDLPTRFYGRFADCMEMYAPVPVVAKYFDTHQEWFGRCAQPMKVEPLGKTGYALLVGRFGAFGYDVEPKIGLELLPGDRDVYRIKTIAVPDYIAPGYDVDFKAVMQLAADSSHPKLTSEVTRVEWQLDLAVYLHFPKFIQRLPKALVQTTGDRLLNQIVRQVSRRLTHKVQEDFHKSLGLTIPPQAKRTKQANLSQ